MYSRSIVGLFVVLSSCLVIILHHRQLRHLSQNLLIVLWFTQSSFDWCILNLHFRLTKLFVSLEALHSLFFIACWVRKSKVNKEKNNVFLS